MIVGEDCDLDTGSDPARAPPGRYLEQFTSPFCASFSLFKKIGMVMREPCFSCRLLWGLGERQCLGWYLANRKHSVKIAVKALCWILLRNWIFWGNKHCPSNTDCRVHTPTLKNISSGKAGTSWDFFPCNYWIVFVEGLKEIMCFFSP